MRYSEDIERAALECLAPDFMLFRHRTVTLVAFGCREQDGIGEPHSRWEAGGGDVEPETLDHLMLGNRPDALSVS